MPAARSWYLRVSRRNSGHSTDSGACRSWPSVKIPSFSSRAAVFAPTPNRRPTGSGSSIACTSCGPDHREPVGLSHLRAELCEQLVVRDADGGGEAGAVADPPLDLARHVGAVAEEPDAAGDVEESLVQRQAFHLVRELAKHLEYLRRDLAVALEARRHDHRMRTAPECLAHRHRGVHAEAAHLVARGRDHAAAAGAADDQRLARELGPVVLLDGRVERVHVDMQDRALRIVHDSESTVNTSPIIIVTPSSRN